MTPAPQPRAPRPSARALLFTALSVLVGGFTVSAVVASSIGMALGAEPYRGPDLWSSSVFAALGAVVLWIAWRAHRRRGAGAVGGAALVARLAPVLAGVGGAVGLAAGVRIAMLGLDATASTDRSACRDFTGPLEPRDPEACQAVARDCRHEVDAGPTPQLSRGVPADVVVPEGLALPSTARPRAVANCMLARSAEFVR